MHSKWTPVCLSFETPAWNQIIAAVFSYSLCGGGRPGVGHLENAANGLNEKASRHEQPGSKGLSKSVKKCFDNNGLGWCWKRIWLMHESFECARGNSLILPPPLWIVTTPWCYSINTSFILEQNTLLVRHTKSLHATICSRRSLEVKLQSSNWITGLNRFLHTIWPQSDKRIVYACGVAKLKASGKIGILYSFNRFTCICQHGCFYTDLFARPCDT